MRMKASQQGIGSAVILALVVGACGWRDVTVTITFKDARGLRAGQPLVYNGVKAGEVSAIGLDPSGRARVDVAVPSRYREVLYLEADYAISSPGGLLDTSGERQIEVGDRPGPRTPLKDGAVIQGREPLLDLLVRGARDAAVVAWEETQKLGQLVADEIATSESGRRLAEEMRRLGERVATGGADVAPGLEKARRQAEAYRDELLRLGRGEDAQAFWGRFERWCSDMRTAVERAPWP